MTKSQGIRISGLAAGLTLLDHTGQPISRNHDGSYSIDPTHTDVTLVSDHDMSGHSPGFETVVTTENVAMGVQTVTTQHESGHVDHVDTPIVSHDEPVDDGVVSATVTVEFDFVEDDGTAAGQGEGALSPNDPEGFIDDNSPTNPYLAAIGAHSPSGNAIADNGVRRQSFWNQERRKLSECSAHLVGVIMRRVGCDASVALQASFV